MREDLLTVMREIFERNPFAERLAYGPDEAGELLGISGEPAHDLLCTGAPPFSAPRKPSISTCAHS